MTAFERRYLTEAAAAKGAEHGSMRRRQGWRCYAVGLSSSWRDNALLLTVTVRRFSNHEIGVRGCCFQ